MKILMSSHVFWPNLGGLEAVSEMLAQEFVRLDHKVTLITQTPSVSQEDISFPFPVVRRPKLGELVRLVKNADIFFHNNISLRVVWPLLFVSKPWVVAHHSFIPVAIGINGLRVRLKQRMLRYAKGISISEAVARHLDTPSVIIPNPYDTSIFCEISGIPRAQDLVFVGRFVSSKGLPILLGALRQLAERGLKPSLTVIGKGPEEKTWRELVQNLDLAEQVTFVGVKRGLALAESLNAHKILVVPSIGDEAFGIVALEGIACGCIVIGSEGGRRGIKDAIGPCGTTFPSGDVDALATCLSEMLCNPDCGKQYRLKARAHLARHRPEVIAKHYLEVFNSAMQRVSDVGSQ